MKKCFQIEITHHKSFPVKNMEKNYWSFRVTHYQMSYRTLRIRSMLCKNKGFQMISLDLILMKAVLWQAKILRGCKWPIYQCSVWKLAIAIKIQLAFKAKK
jgi:hypothetical protein